MSILWFDMKFLLSTLLIISLPLFSQDAEPELVVVTLSHAIERVLSENRQLASAYQSAEQSNLNIVLNEAEFDLAITPSGDVGYVGGGKAGTGPTVSAGVEFSKRFSLGTRISVQPMVIKAAKNFQSQLNARITQPLLRGFGKFENLAPLEAAKFAQRSALRNLMSTQFDTVLRAIQSVYDVKRQEEFVALDMQTVERLRKFWEAAKRKEKIGLCDSLDVYRAEIELQHAENSLEQSQDRLQDSKDTLNDLLAYPLDTPLEVDVPLQHHPLSISVDEAVQIALQYRLEIYQAWDQLNESRRLACLAKKRIFPELNLVLDFSNTGWNEVFTESFYRRRESTWGVGFTSSTDLDRTGDRVAFQQSLYQVKSSERAYAQARDNIVLEVKRVMRSIASTMTRMENVEDQIKSAKGALHLARIKYEHGLCNNFDLIQAEKNLQAAQVSKISTEIEHIIDEYKLLDTLGILANSNNLSICGN